MRHDESWGLEEDVDDKARTILWSSSTRGEEDIFEDDDSDKPLALFSAGGKEAEPNAVNCSLSS